MDDEERTVGKCQVCLELDLTTAFTAFRGACPKSTITVDYLVSTSKHHALVNAYPVSIAMLI